MKLLELLNTLQEIADGLGEEAAEEYDVLLATQPNYPLAFNIAGATCMALDGEFNEEGYAVDPDPDKEYDGDKVVWICEGGHPYNRSPYAPRNAWHSY